MGGQVIRGDTKGLASRVQCSAHCLSVICHLLFNGDTRVGT